MSNLAVFIPGIGYTCDRPLLHYARSLAIEAGYDECLPVTFKKVDKTGLRGNAEKMKEVYLSLFEMAKESLSSVEWEKYDNILIVSKSIGTVVATSYEQLLRENHNNLPPIKHILFTPLEQTFAFPAVEGISFIGTSDPWSDVNKVISMAQNKNIPINVYEGANHSLETGNTFKDLENLTSILNICKEYLS